ncbi:MAG: hypothetical protein OEZ68_03810 [Gammaproteobacteria bacterium]|nr:hypothetical protein [Gammaproteobacteria bacterium]
MSAQLDNCKTMATLSTISRLLLACDHLDLYRAELARILGLQCPQVSDEASLDQILAQNSNAAYRAERFLLFFEALLETFPQDNVRQINWMRRQHAALGNTPLLALVDEGRLEELIELLQRS